MRRRAWIIPAAVLGLLSLLIVVRVPGKGVLHRTLLDAVHGPIFAVVAVLLLLFLSRRAPARSGRTVYLVAFVIAVGLGILIEILQTITHRPGSAFDVMTNAAGAAAGLAFWWLHAQVRATTVRLKRSTSAWVATAIGLAGISFVAWYPLQAARAYAHRAAVFPSIAEFRAAQDLTFVEPGGSDSAIVPLPAPWGRGPEDRGLRVTYDAEHAPSLQVLEPSRDWRGYSVIAVDLTNPGDRELGLTFRIFDATHDGSPRDRLNLPLTIPPRTRTIVRVALDAVEHAPESRRMDLSRIADVMLFGRTPPEPAEFYVSRIWLE